MLKPILIILILSSLLFVSVFLMFLQPLQAQLDPMVELKKAGGEAYYGNTGQAPTHGENLSNIVGKIIGNVLIFLGTIAVVLIVYAGFLWMTAGGNEEQIKKARGLLINAVIGLIITLAAYGIAHYVVKELVGATK